LRRGAFVSRAMQRPERATTNAQDSWFVLASVEVDDVHRRRESYTSTHFGTGRESSCSHYYRRVSEELPPVALWQGEDIDPADIFARGCVMNEGESTYDPEDVLPWVANLRTAFPDIRFAVEGWFSAGTRYVLRFCARGTHTGPFATEIGTAAPSGKPFTAHGIEVFDVRDDRIVGVWEAWDWRRIYALLGARIES
jgi:predicted ester cyclase